MTITPAHEIPLAVRRKAAAVHEAGHALVAVFLKRHVTGAVLRPPHGLSGVTQFESEPVMLDLNAEAGRRFVEDAVVILLAGQIAEAQYWKGLAALYAPQVNSHRTDDAEIKRLRSLFDFGPEQDAMFVGYCTDKARRIVLHESAQAAIEEIATKLADDRSIGREALNGILLRHGAVQGKLKFTAHPWQRHI